MRFEFHDQTLHCFGWCQDSPRKAESPYLTSSLAQEPKLAVCTGMMRIGSRTAWMLTREREFVMQTGTAQVKLDSGMDWKPAQEPEFVLQTETAKARLDSGMA